MKKYLVLTASYWSWHNAAAQWINNYLEQKWKEIKILDMTELLKKWWYNSKKFYAFSEKFPIVWDTTFNMLDKQITNEILNVIFKSIYQKHFNELMDEFHPDYVICTFPNWPIFLNNYINFRRKYFKTAVIITDAIEIWTPWHFWNENVDNFFVIDENTKKVFKKKFKHKKNNVNISFFPIEKKYFHDKNTINNKHIGLLLTWLKVDFASSLLSKLKKEDFYEKIKIIKWRNLKLFIKLKEKFKDNRFEFIDYINLKEELKNIDIFITKPGWALMCECIAQDVPIIAPSFTPGQEEWNISLLETENIWYFENDIKKIIFSLKYTDFTRMLPNFKKIKKVDSIEYIINKLESKKNK